MCVRVCVCVAVVELTGICIAACAWMVWVRSLGGNSKTRVIATLSPSQNNIEESVATLKVCN